MGTRADHRSRLRRLGQAQAARSGAKRPGPRQRGYDGTWQSLRAKVIAAWVSAGWPCAKCGEAIRVPRSAHVDHIERIRDNPDRRLDLSNLRVLCGRCHNRRTAHDENDDRRGFSTETDAEGAPVDPRHHWWR